MKQAGIYRLKPFAVSKPWGGGHLDSLKVGHIEGKIGEFVLFSDLDQFPVRVEVDGNDVLLSEFWPTLSLTEKQLPFMLKLLSTDEALSLQNHPSDADVIALGLTGQGKFECWTILDSAPDARAYLGLKAGESSKVLRDLAHEAEPMAHFNECQLQRGDVVILEPGLVHSTVGKLLFYEIQQKSDHTFRIYDFGRPRSLQVDEAIYCIKDQKPNIQKFSQALRTEKFSVSYHENPRQISRQGKEFSVFTWLGARAQLTHDDSTHTLHWGDSLLVLTSDALQISSIETEEIAELPALNMFFEAYV